MSRHPVSTHQRDLDDSFFLSITRVHNTEHDSFDPARIAVVAAVKHIQAVSAERMEHETARDPSLQTLIQVIEKGFPASKSACPDSVKEYF